MCRRDQGDIGNAAKVKDAAAFLLVPKACNVQGRRQRRSLSASSHIPAPEIGYRSDAGEFGYLIRIANLYGVGVCAGGIVANGLAVTANGDDIARIDFRFRK